MAKNKSRRGIDANGNPAIDPTENVMNLVESETRRTDDLRAMAIELNRVMHDSERRHAHTAAKRTRAEAVQTRELLSLEVKHAEDLRLAEQKRIDAIRAVDAAAVQTAAVAAENRAGTLAQQVATAADTLRTVVAAAAQQADTALKAETDPIKKDVVDLRRYQYEGVGQKTQVTETRAGSTHVGMWIGIGVATFAALGTIGASWLATAVAVVLYFMKR